MLLTDDGRLQRASAIPAQMEKTYLVQVEGLPDETALAALRDGSI